jgi:hypothetical protein
VAQKVQSLDISGKHLFTRSAGGVVHRTYCMRGSACTQVAQRASSRGAGRGDDGGTRGQAVVGNHRAALSLALEQLERACTPVSPALQA